MRKKRRVSKLAIKLTALFLIVVFPLTIFSAFTYYRNYASLKQKTYDSIHQNSSVISSTINETMWNVFHAHSALNVDETIMYMIGAHNRLDDYQHYKNVREVLERLSLMKLSLPVVSEIRLHVPSLERSFISDGTAKQLMDECQYYIEHIDRFFSIRAGKEQLTLACRYPWLNVQKHSYYLVTEIDCQKIKNDILMQHANPYDNIFFYYADDQNQTQLITSYGNKALFEAFHENYSITGEYEKIHLDGEAYLSADVDTGFFGLRVLSLIPEKAVFGELQTQSKMMGWVLGLTVVLILFFIQMIIRMIHHPLRKLSEAFAQVQDGNLNTEIVSQNKDEFGDIYQQFNDMTSQMQRLIDENNNSRLLVQETKMRQLQAQVNPHFLYNCFRNIYAMAQMEDYEGIMDITEKLTAFYRYTAKGNRDTVQLYQEDEYACAYLGIQGLRFEERLEVRMEELPDALREAPALHFSIQTIAENACKYALPTRTEGAVIALSYQQHPDGYVVTVDDNGTAMTDDKINELNKIILSGDLVNSGTGLMNLQQRLRIRWGEHAGLTFSRSALGGLRVEMYVFWRKKQNSTQG